jgi:hypothetical protein
MTNAHKPTAPADPTDLKTWTEAQLTYAAPFWVAKLEKQLLSDLALVAYTPQGTQLHLDALKLRSKTQEQLTFWKLVLSDRIFRVRPHSLRTHHRNGSAATHRGTPAKRDTKVGNWDKTLGLWG